MQNTETMTGLFGFCRLFVTVLYFYSDVSRVSGVVIESVSVLGVELELCKGWRRKWQIEEICRGRKDCRNSERGEIQ